MVNVVWLFVAFCVGLLSAYVSLFAVASTYSKVFNSRSLAGKPVDVLNGHLPAIVHDESGDHERELAEKNRRMMGQVYDNVDGLGGLA